MPYYNDNEDDDFDMQIGEDEDIPVWIVIMIVLIVLAAIVGAIAGIVSALV